LNEGRAQQRQQHPRNRRRIVTGRCQDFTVRAPTALRWSSSREMFEA
jgi:hypothetical protein